MSTRPQTLVGLVQSYAESQPHEVALREKRLGIWQGITWKEYLEAIEAVAFGLSKLGVGPGDHVGILSDNCPQWLYVDLAVQSLGARSVGIYQTNPPADVAYCLSHSEAKVLFCEDQEQVDKAIQVQDETPTVAHVVVFDPRGTRHYQDERLLRWDEFFKNGEISASAEPTWFSKQIAAMDPQAPAMIIYTSGTTGQPKGAMVSNRNVLELAQRTCTLLGVQKSDTLLSYLPLCHVAEKIFSLFVPLTVGAVVHFGESIGTVRADLQEVSP
jgi:long-chain acyl-CoA synthetase